MPKRPQTECTSCTLPFHYDMADADVRVIYVDGQHHGTQKIVQCPRCTQPVVVGTTPPASELVASPV